MTDPPPLVHRVPARPDQVGFVRRQVTAYGLAHGVIDPYALGLAVSEAVSNAVLHAYVDATSPGEIEVIAQRHSDDGLEVRVCDDGRGMRPRPDSSGAGVGLPIIAAMTAQVQVQARRGGGTQIRMTFAAA
jgi:serine/threonine-protein kinase RsbW